MEPVGEDIMLILSLEIEKVKKKKKAMQQIPPHLHVTVLQHHCDHGIAEDHLNFCMQISSLSLQVLPTLICNGGRERKEVWVVDMLIDQLDKYTKSRNAGALKQWKRTPINIILPRNIQLHFILSNLGKKKIFLMTFPSIPNGKKSSCPTTDLCSHWYNQMHGCLEQSLI